MISERLDRVSTTHSDLTELSESAQPTVSGILRKTVKILSSSIDIQVSCINCSMQDIEHTKKALTLGAFNHCTTLLDEHIIQRELCYQFS